MSKNLGLEEVTPLQAKNITQLNKIEKIQIYPCKGLSSIELNQYELLFGRGIKGDREYAFQFLDTIQASATSQISLPHETEWLSKKYLLNQHDFPELARLRWQEFNFESENKNYDEFFSQFTREKITLLETSMNQNIQGFTPISTARHPEKFAMRLIGKKQVVSQLHRSSEQSENFAESEKKYYFRDSIHHEISFLNLESLKDFENTFQNKIEPERFRANIFISLPEPWLEMKFKESDFFEIKHPKINQGNTVTLQFVKLISRCLNINVCPKKGEINKNLLQHLNTHYKHPFFGFSAKVVSEFQY